MRCVNSMSVAVCGALGITTPLQVGQLLPQPAPEPVTFTLAGAALGLVGSAFHWVVPDAFTLGLLVIGGLIGGVGQLLLTEALRVAPVGVVAPFDYIQLVWATGLGFLIWGELPHAATLAGALVVAASGVYILHRELVRRRSASPVIA